MPKRVDEVIGEGNAREVMWASLEGWTTDGKFKMNCGSSTSLTCEQDNQTLKDVQELGGTISARGVEIMSSIMSRKLKQLMEYWEVEE